MQIESYEGMGVSISIAKAQQLVLKILDQCYTASDSELSLAASAIDTIFTDQGEWVSYEPHVVQKICEHIDKLWSIKNHAKFRFCAEIIMGMSLSHYFVGLSQAAASDDPFIKGRAIFSIRCLSDYDDRCRSVFRRFNTILNVSGADLNRDIEKDVLSLRDSVPILQKTEPKHELLPDVKSSLPLIWEDEIYADWLDALISDYRALFAEIY